MVKKRGSVCDKNDNKDIVKTKKKKQLQVIVLIATYVIFINHNI